MTRRSLTVMVSGAVVAALATVGATHAAAVTEPALDVSLTTISPLILTPGTSLTVAGTITNLTNVPAEGLVVRLRLGTTPVGAGQFGNAGDESPPSSGRTQVDAAVREVLTTATDTQREPATRTITSWIDVASVIPGGGRSSFELVVPAMPVTDPGVYVLAVEAFARDSENATTLGGVQRTLLPWYAEPELLTPIKVAWLWPFQAPPAWDANGVLLDETLPRALAPGGYLRQRLDLGMRYPNLLTWIADPALLQMTSAMSDGYLVRTAGGVAPGRQIDEAAAWQSDFTAVMAALQDQPTTAGSPVLYLEPYGGIDASAARRADLGGDVVQAVTMGPAIAAAATGVDRSQTIYVAPGGLLDRQTAGLLASAGTRYVVLNPAAEQGVVPAPLTAFAPAVPDLLAVVPNAGLQRLLGTGTDDVESTLLTRQAFLASTALYSQFAPDQSVILVPMTTATPQQILSAALRVTAEAPWIQAVQLDQIPVQSSSSGYTYGGAGRRAELPGSYLARVRQTQQRLDRFVAILSEPNLVFEPYSEALLRTQSSAWRVQPRIGEELLTSVTVQLDAQRSAVGVLNGGSLTLSGDSGRIPITVSNALTQPVHLGIRLIGNPRVRLTAESVTDITVAPGATTSIDVPVRVAGSEPLRVSVQILTPEGTVFRAVPAATVYSAAYARTASWVVAIAFVAILIFVLVGIIRRVKKAYD